MLLGYRPWSRELGGKRLELLKEIAPKNSRIGVLWYAAGVNSELILKEFEPAARALKLQLHDLAVRGGNPDFDGVFKAAVQAGVNALIVDRSPVFNRFAKQVGNLAIKNRLPSMFAGSEYVEAGGLVSYATDIAAQYRRVAYYVDKILKGDQARGTARRAADEVRVRDQSENRQADRPDDSAVDADEGG